MVKSKKTRFIPYKTIGVDKENYLELYNLKFENNFRNFNQALTYVLNKCKNYLKKEVE